MPKSRNRTSHKRLVKAGDRTLKLKQTIDNLKAVIAEQARGIAAVREAISRAEDPDELRRVLHVKKFVAPPELPGAARIPDADLHDDTPQSEAKPTTATEVAQALGLLSA